MMMKSKTAFWFLGVAALAAMGGAARGEVVATARSPEGEFEEFRVVLDAMGEPVAVANFMGLVDGSRPWVDRETGRVRGGAGDAFYAGMVFSEGNGTMMAGGLRGRKDGDGTVAYTDGPGYTVLGKTNEAWTAFGRGALALAETGGPHSGGGELVLFLTNGVTGWTVFGQVAPGGAAGVEALSARVEGGAATEVEWTVDASGATEGELAALAEAEAWLPRATGVRTGFGEEWRLEFEWPGQSRLGIWYGGDLMEDMQYTDGGWNDGTESWAMSIGWEEAGLEGQKGFLGFTAVRYPGMTGEALRGKWRMLMEHTGQWIQYWFDFDGGTGMWAVVESGQIADSGYLANIQTGRTAGNSVGMFFGVGLTANYYYLGFGEAGARTGRFMSRQLVGNESLDWGMFKMVEGWGEGEEAGDEGEKRKCTMGGAGGEGRWVEWKKVGEGDWEKAVRGLGRRDRTW